MSAIEAEELVRRYTALVFNLALRLCGNRADAEDLAQQSLIRAIQALPRFRGEADPGVWLYRITVNAWKNSLRAKSARPVLRFFGLEEKEVLSEPDLPGPDPTPERLAEAGEAKARLDRALEALSPEERAVLVLRELDGRSYAEIAEALDLPLGTVKSRLARARAELAVRLGVEENDDVR